MCKCEGGGPGKGQRRTGWGVLLPPGVRQAGAMCTGVRGALISRQPQGCTCSLQGPLICTMTWKPAAWGYEVRKKSSLRPTQLDSCSPARGRKTPERSGILVPNSQGHESLPGDGPYARSGPLTTADKGILAQPARDASSAMALTS